MHWQHSDHKLLKLVSSGSRTDGPRLIAKRICIIHQPKEIMFDHPGKNKNAIINQDLMGQLFTRTDVADFYTSSAEKNPVPYANKTPKSAFLATLDF
jgi:hypothetical protein